MIRRRADSFITHPTLELPAPAPAPAPAPSAGGIAAGTQSWRRPAAEAPRRLGRFVLLEWLGAGGTGVVRAAFDEQLERKVAIKLVRTAGDALLREAQAQARLSHPHVVEIYEVGALDDGGAFIAMELVKGETLRRWQAGRDWRAIVAQYVAAGRGLAAAHRAGLVHRDFKPDNILVGDDGRVKVADFGLACASDAVPGRVAGTLGYLAPELFTGAPANARSDQFSFCVALHEALHGERPFADRAFVPGVIAEPRRVAPAGHPRWLGAIVARGLARSPDERFASMDDLLAELARDRAVRGRRLAIAALTGALGAAITAGALGTAASPPCALDPSALAGAWDPAIRERARAALVATGAPFAGAVWASTAAAFDRYALDWTLARQAACVATHVRHAQPDRVLDLRMACLAGRRRTLAAAAETLRSQPTAALGHAGDLLASLGDLDACGDGDALRALDAGRPPVPAATQLAIDGVRGELARASAAITIGELADAAPLVDDARARAAALGDDRLRAEVAFAAGRIQLARSEVAGALAQLHAAIDQAIASHDDELVADIWLRLAVSAGGREQRPAEIARWLAQGEAWVRRIGHPSAARQIELALARGYLALTAGDARAADAALSRGLALAEPVWGAGDPRLIPLLRARSNARGTLRRVAPAVADAERALAIGIAAWGPAYPDIAATRAALGLLYLDQLGDVERGARELGLARDLYRASLGADAIDVAICEQGLAKAHELRGDYAAALRDAEHAEAIFVRRLGADNPRRGEALMTIGALRFLRKDFAGSLVAYEAAYPIFRAAFGADHLQLGFLLSNTGETLLALDRGAAAEADFTRARAILEHALGAHHAALAFPLKGLGLAELARGRPGEALAPLERALAVTEAAAASDPQELAAIRWGVVRALTGLGREPRRARSLAEAALAGYRQLGDESAGQAHEIARWLTAQRDRR